MPERRQLRQPGPKNESVRFGRDPTHGPIGGSATPKKHSRLLQPRSEPYRTTATARRTAPGECVERPGVAARRARSEPLQTRTPSRPGPCESMHEEFAQQLDNHAVRLAAQFLLARPFQSPDR